MPIESQEQLIARLKSAAEKAGRVALALRNVAQAELPAEPNTAELAALLKPAPPQASGKP